jgi:hypothetical protein
LPVVAPVAVHEAVREGEKEQHLKEETHLIRRIAIGIGMLTAVTGLAMLAVSFSPEAQDVSAQEGTSTSTTGGATTPATGGTSTAGTPGAGGASTPGPLTPVSTPTTGSGAASTPVAGGASGLPATGTGTDGGGLGWVAGLGLLMAIVGVGVAATGFQRRA